MKRYLQNGNQSMLKDASHIKILEVNIKDKERNIPLLVNTINMLTTKNTRNGPPLKRPYMHFPLIGEGDLFTMKTISLTIVLFLLCIH